MDYELGAMSVSAFYMVLPPDKAWNSRLRTFVSNLGLKQKAFKVISSPIRTAYDEQHKEIMDWARNSLTLADADNNRVAMKNGVLREPVVIDGSDPIVNMR